MAQVFNRLLVVVCVALTALQFFPLPLEAAELTAESVALTDPTVGQAGVTYDIVLGGQSTAAIRCITVRFTGTIGTNDPPAGMDIGSAVFDAASTIVPTPAAWSAVGVNGTGIVMITNALGENPAGGANRTLILNGITNGSAGNTTYYAEVNTFADAGCTALVDTDGQAAFVFTSGVLVTSTVNDVLNFSLTPGCSAGELNQAAAKTCTLEMHASTNHPTGYSVSYSAVETMHEASHLDTIAAVGATAQTSAPGTKQFGFNLVGNMVPTTGADPVGGTGAAFGQYAIADKFAFTTAGGTIASAASSSSDTQYTVSYLVNVEPNMVSGSYVAQQTYTIVVNP